MIQRLRSLLFIPIIFFTYVSSIADDQADKIISELSLKEKVGQMILVYNSPLDFLKKYNIGGVLIMHNMLKKPSELKGKLDMVQKKIRIPLIVSIDQEGGTVNRLSSMSRWKKTPSAEAISQWSEDSIIDYYRKVALALLDIGINLNLAPVLDPAKNHAGNKTYIAIKKRAYGTQVNEILPPAQSFIKAFNEKNIGCVVKHFPGYDVDVNSDYKIAISTADSMAVIRNTAPFKAMEKNYDGIMMSSILYKVFCQEPAVLCKKMVKLARDISPGGVIITDDLWGTALRSYTYPGKKIDHLNYPDSAFVRIVELAVKAGNDMLMITYPIKVELIIDKIIEMANEDKAILEHVNAAVRRIMLLKSKLKLLR
ncbi:MAG: glycoside hydrolase family 3 N-terminal domain-containing protein [Chitinispirillia bacterium]|jgi:beta-N-acetylhexosaminidase